MVSPGESAEDGGEASLLLWRCEWSWSEWYVADGDCYVLAAGDCDDYEWENDWYSSDSAMANRCGYDCVSTVGLGYYVVLFVVGIASEVDGLLPLMANPLALVTTWSAALKVVNLVGRSRRRMMKEWLPTCYSFRLAFRLGSSPRLAFARLSVAVAELSRLVLRWQMTSALVPVSSDDVRVCTVEFRLLMPLRLESPRKTSTPVTLKRWVSCYRVLTCCRRDGQVTRC